MYAPSFAARPDARTEAAADPNAPLAFGKYCGRRIVDMDDVKYLRWLCSWQLIVDGSGSLRRVDAAEVHKREIDENLGVDMAHNYASSVVCAEAFRAYAGSARTWADALSLARKTEGVIPGMKNKSIALWLNVTHRPTVLAARGEYARRRLCLLCAGPLVPIGDARANGAPHADWDGRYLHKHCFITYMKTHA